MIVKDLILQLPLAEVAAAVIRDSDIPADKVVRAMELYEDYIHRLRPIQPVDSKNYVMLGIVYRDHGEERLNATLFKKDEIAGEFVRSPEFDALHDVDDLSDDDVERLIQQHALPQTYAFDLDPWGEVLGYEVHEANIQDIDPVEFAADIINEMTFNGLFEEDVAERRSQLYEALREADEIIALPEEERSKHTYTLDDLRVHDTRTPEEIAASHRALRREALTNILRIYQALVKYVANDGN